MTDTRPILLWFRRDLRLADHPAVAAAAASGRPVIPVVLNDEGVAALGAAPRLRLGMGVEAFARRLEGAGSRLVLRSGPALPALRALVAETGAGAAWWTRLHDPASRGRDDGVATGLAADGVEARAFPGHLVAEPDAVRSKAGGGYRVFAPFAKALRAMDPGEATAAPSRLRGPEAWPGSERLEAWRLGAAMDRGGSVVAAWQRPGEAAARERLAAFLAERLSDYAGARDHPGRDGSSRLSENLTLGEVGAATCWRAGLGALEAGEPGAEAFLRELAWREFSHHLLWHEPTLPTEEWRPAWRTFPWRAGGPAATAWARGMTGVPLVDAGMREMWVTGRMHNRVRMVTASFLCKHLLTDWRVGLAAFADCLTDWDPASNAVNWQWVAGSGPDATPFFRVFSPQAQAERWDGEGAYVRAWVAEGQAKPPETALSFFDAVPRSWGLSPRAPYPEPVVALAEGRAAALAAFRAHRAAGEAPRGA